VQAAAAASGYCLIAASATDFEENAAAAVATVFNDARQCRPEIIFLDEAEAYFAARKEPNSTISELLTQIDGVGHDNKNIVVVAATNLPWKLDAAVLRRLNSRAFVGLPNAQERLILLRQAFASNSSSISEQEMTRQANSMTNFSAAEIDNFERQALMAQLRMHELY
jgi:vacuolar protein-sorting-associated protein 4